MQEGEKTKVCTNNSETRVGLVLSLSLFHMLFILFPLRICFQSLIKTKWSWKTLLVFLAYCTDQLSDKLYLTKAEQSRFWNVLTGRNNRKGTLGTDRKIFVQYLKQIVMIIALWAEHVDTDEERFPLNHCYPVNVLQYKKNCFCFVCSYNRSFVLYPYPVFLSLNRPLITMFNSIAAGQKCGFC